MSAARALIHDGKEYKPLRTGFAAYRATVEVDKMLQDPDTAWLLEKPGLNIWYAGISKNSRVSILQNPRLTLLLGLGTAAM